MDTRIVTAEGDAVREGRRAGELELRPGSNPHPVGTRKNAEWEQWRRSVEAHRLAAELRQRARVAPCRYTKGTCFCGGRGLCLDVA